MSGYVPIYESTRFDHELHTRDSTTSLGSMLIGDISPDNIASTGAVNIAPFGIFYGGLPCQTHAYTAAYG